MSDRPTRAYIPPNLSETGGMFGGMLKTRNVVEAVIYVALFFILGKIISSIIPFSFSAIATAVGAIIVGVIALIGIGGEPLSIFFLNIVNYRRSKAFVPIKLPLPEKPTKKSKNTENSNEKGGVQGYTEQSLEQFLNGFKKS